QIKSLSRFPLAQQELATWVPIVRDRWPEHQRQVRDVLMQRRTEYRQEFSRRMQQRYREEARLTQTVFGERLRELEQQQRPGHIKAMLRDIEEQRKRLLQPVLFTELQLEQEQQQQSLQELEWEYHAIDYIERIKRLVIAEQQRIM